LLAGDAVLHVHSRPVAGPEHFPYDLEPGLQVDTGAHDDVVDARLGESGPRIVESRPAEQLEMRHIQLLSRFLDDDSGSSEQ
jgi:hypothetical protein